MNISKGDVLELRRRMTKEGCTIDYLCGCYVDGNKNIILNFKQDFAELEEDAFFKYLEIAKKVLSSSLGANLLELEFMRNETGNEHQRYLYALKASKMENEELLNRLYEKIIENYQYVGNYLIVVFHDVYDVPSRSKDRAKLEESVETYEYIIAAICPVDFSKVGLMYNEQESCIGVTDRNWVVGAPDLGFVYPAFSNHGADASAVAYYVKTGKDSHAEFVEEVLGCVSQRTAGEEKSAFREVIEDCFEDEQQGESVFLKVQKQISDMTMPDPDAPVADEVPPVTLTKAALSEVVDAVDMPVEAREIILEAFEHEFGDQLPTAQNVLDKKLVEESVQRLRTAQLETQLTDLKDQLNDKEKALTEAKQTVRELETVVPAITDPDDPAEISVHVSIAKARQISTKNVGGVRCLVIPIEQGESASINGIPAELNF